MQKAGSILLEVEKKNVKHFEVETPYLAAVVKGTQFRVTVNADTTSVDVIRGQVQVADFKSGQIAQVMPGQHATAFAHGKSGLSLGGSGTFSPIEHGKPRPSSVERVPVPRAGLSAPGKPRIGGAARRTGMAAQRTRPQAWRHAAFRPPLGEVKLNFHRVTNGLARGSDTATGPTEAPATDTVWSSRIDSGSQAANNSGQSGNGTGAATAAGSGDGFAQWQRRSPLRTVAATAMAATETAMAMAAGTETKTATATAMGTATGMATATAMATAAAATNRKRAAD